MAIRSQFTCFDWVDARTSVYIDPPDRHSPLSPKPQTTPFVCLHARNILLDSLLPLATRIYSLLSTVHAMSMNLFDVSAAAKAAQSSALQEEQCFDLVTTIRINTNTSTTLMGATSLPSTPLSKSPPRSILATLTSLGSPRSGSPRSKTRPRSWPHVQRQRPIPNSYWATPLLLACEYPYTPFPPPSSSGGHSRQKLDSLLLVGVRTFIDLTESGELFPYDEDVLKERAEIVGVDISEIEYHRFGIRDRSLPESVDYMYKVLEVLRDNEQRGRVSAVHCRGGIGRTGMVIGCWLVQSGKVTDGEDALRYIAQEWSGVAKCKIYPHSPETGPQFEFVRNFRARQVECCW